MYYFSIVHLNFILFREILRGSQIDQSHLRHICNEEKVFEEIEKLDDKKDVIHKLGHNDNS